MSTGQTLLAAGATLGAAAFLWNGLEYVVSRRRRLWADDLRRVLLKVQSVTDELRFYGKPQEWTRDELTPVMAELRAVSERMPTWSYQRSNVGLLYAKLSLCDTYANREKAEVTHDSTLRTQRQVAAAERAHDLTIRLLRRA